MTKRVILGKHPTKSNDYGLWVSKPTKNVETASGDDLVFDTGAYPYAGYLFSGTSKSTDSGWDTKTVSSWVPINGWPVPTLIGKSRKVKEIPFADFGIDRAFTNPPLTIFMVRIINSDNATPSYTITEKANFAGQATATEWDVVGGSCMVSCRLDSQNKGILTLRIDKSDYSPNMSTNLEFSFVVFQNFSSLAKLKDANGYEVG